MEAPGYTHRSGIRETAMTRRVAWIAGILGVGALVGALPAYAIGFNLGIGGRLGNSGVSTGANYRFGRGGAWGDRLQTFVHLNANQLLDRRRSRPARPGEGREPVVVDRGKSTDPNVELRVKPDTAWVFLNGTRVKADGREKILLPAGKQRLEFLAPGYRVESAELEIQSGVRYRVERKLIRLEKGEQPDPRLASSVAPVSVEAAVASARASIEPVAAPAPTDR